MKRTLITFLAVMFAAAGASAVTFFGDLDQNAYLPGEEITITVTADYDGTESVGAFGSYGVIATWDPSVATVANRGSSDFGTGSQSITGGGSALTGDPVSLAGPAAPLCSNAGDNCAFLTQTNAGFDTVALDAQQLVATLVLTVTGVAGAAGNAGISLAFSGDDGVCANNACVSDRLAAGGVIVPEPTTGLMLGLGLLGLGFGGRRR